MLRYLLLPVELSGVLLTIDNVVRVGQMRLETASDILPAPQLVFAQLDHALHVVCQFVSILLFQFFLSLAFGFHDRVLLILFLLLAFSRSHRVCPLVGRLSCRVTQIIVMIVVILEEG